MYVWNLIRLRTQCKMLFSVTTHERCLFYQKFHPVVYTYIHYNLKQVFKLNHPRESYFLSQKWQSIITVGGSVSHVIIFKTHLLIFPAQNREGDITFFQDIPRNDFRFKIVPATIPKKISEVCISRIIRGHTNSESCYSSGTPTKLMTSDFRHVFSTFLSLKCIFGLILRKQSSMKII